MTGVNLIETFSHNQIVKYVELNNLIQIFVISIVHILKTFILSISPTPDRKS